MDTLHGLHVWGDFACFTRPEMKVERFSYPLITPSAARGILDAIYVKPAKFIWQVVRVEVLRPPSYLALRRNEVKNKGLVNSISRAMNDGARSLDPILADEDREATGRTQRQTMALRDVEYVIWAKIKPWPECDTARAALDDQFRRRAKSGKCFCQPSFGCREFPAYFEYVDRRDDFPASVALDLDVGWMIYDVFDLSKRGNATSRAAVSLFWASVKQGIMEVPPYGSAEVKKVTR